MNVISFAEVWHKRNPEGRHLTVNDVWRSLNILRDEDFVALAKDLIEHDYATALLVARLPANGQSVYGASYLLRGEFSKDEVKQAVRVGRKRRLIRRASKRQGKHLALTDYGRNLQRHVCRLLHHNFSKAG